MDVYDRLDQHLARLKAAGESHADFAKRAGMQPADLSRARKHRKGLDGHWPAIAKALGVSLDWLHFGEAPPAAQAPPVDSIGEINRALLGENHRLREQLRRQEDENAQLRAELAAALSDLRGASAPPVAPPTTAPPVVRPQ